MSTLLVSSVGGHLAELRRLLPRLEGIDADRYWVTFDTPQSRSMLAGESVTYVDYTGPRDLRNVLRHTGVARRLLAGAHPFSTIVSAGSGIALSFLPLGRLRGARCHYIESSTRSTGPSLTGRLLRTIPGISLYAQYPGWAEAPWQYRGSVFDNFRSLTSGQPRSEIRRAVVTLGTMEDYAFPRLLHRVLEIMPPQAHVLWQVGCTDASTMPIEAQRMIPADELQAAIAAADVVIAHAGCGSAIAALEAGKKPVMVARLAAYGENVDDHQRLVAAELERRDLAIVRTIEQLSGSDLLLAARSGVYSDSHPAPFALTS